MNKIIGDAVSDIGIQKKVNQDSLMLKIANTKWGKVAFAIVCDGVGGLSQGEVASANVVLAFERWFLEVFPNREETWDREAIRRDWDLLITSINQEIVEYGKEKGIQLGTTVTVALFLDKSYYIFHVGDTRLYEIQKDLKQITKDQTVVAYEVEKGLITEQQAQRDSRKNMLLQCVGLSEKIVPDFIEGNIQENVSYLLCSDGFRNKLSGDEIYNFCNPQRNSSREDIRQSISKLIEIDKERNEKDNLSAILLIIEK